MATEAADRLHFGHLFDNDRTAPFRQTPRNGPPPTGAFGIPTRRSRFVSSLVCILFAHGVFNLLQMETLLCFFSESVNLFFGLLSEFHTGDCALP